MTKLKRNKILIKESRTKIKKNQKKKDQSTNIKNKVQSAYFFMGGERKKKRFTGDKPHNC